MFIHQSLEESRAVAETAKHCALTNAGFGGDGLDGGRRSASLLQQATRRIKDALSILCSVGSLVTSAGNRQFHFGI